MLTYLAKLIELCLYYLYLEGKIQGIGLLQVSYKGYFFLAHCWNDLYWDHLYAPLAVFGLVAKITDEETEASIARLRLFVADTQYDDVPTIRATKAKTIALLEKYEQRKHQV